MYIHVHVYNVHVHVYSCVLDVCNDCGIHVYMYVCVT